MINITNKIECCGCNACGDICPMKAISFKTDVEGFWYPEVNKNLCTNCSLCEKVCPQLHNKELKINDFNPPLCYAAQAKNLESLFNSTSGSAFASFAEKMYKMGGYVGGAIFNDDFSVTQFVSSNKCDLEKIRNSKYVQSSAEGFFLAVRDLLKAEEKVLVCGLPCQMAALKSFLHKNYDNLIIIDLICLGINSPKILRGYIDYKEKLHNSKLVYYKAKNKEMGWRELATKLVFANGDVEYDKKDTNYFTYGFIGTHAYARPSCYECKFKGMPRIADITIGDFWGAEKVIGNEYDHDLGTSAIMINSQKGKDFYDSMKSTFRETEIKYDAVLAGNQALVEPISKPTIDRKSFYEDLNTIPFEDFVKKYITLPCETITKSKKEKLKNVLKFGYSLYKEAGFSIPTLLKNIRYNFFKKNVKTNILQGKYLILGTHTVLDIHKTAKVIVDASQIFGYRRVKGSNLESRLLVESGAILKMGGGTIYYGADIEVFRGATLEMGNVTFNINTTIICGRSITIGDGVQLGRNVTIRDNNGGHFISRRTYKNVRPIIIGKHCWICEHSMLMPGAKLGTGVIVSANSMVSSKIPNFSLCSGSPAEVVDEDIFWKA